MKFPNANEINWNLERDEAVFTIGLDDGRPVDCRVTLEALEEYAGGAKIEDGLSAAQEYLIKFEEDVGFLVAAGRFESDGTVWLLQVASSRMALSCSGRPMFDG